MNTGHKWYTEAPKDDIKAALERVESTAVSHYAGHRIQSDIKHLRIRATALRELAMRDSK